MNDALFVLVIVAAAAAIASAATAFLAHRGQRSTETALHEAKADVARRDTEIEAARRELAETRHAAQVEAAELVRRSQADADDVRRQADDALRRALDAREEQERELRTANAELRERSHDLDRRAERLADRETRLDEQVKRQDTREQGIAAELADLAKVRAELADLEVERRRVLERVAGLSAESARAELIAVVESEAKREAAVQIRQIEREAREQADARAREIITGAVQRVASEQSAEATVAVLHLPSDEMKGRIIGREGRNIKAFEAITGVNVIIDDTPEAVVLSSFDPMRREVARETLEALVLDGRIHPHRIEEVYERTLEHVDGQSMRAGEDALVEVGITDMHPELVAVLGKLRFRTSYGQNVLRHLIETAHVAALMAAELHIPVEMVKRGAFLHDIGKALTHEVEGPHALIGADLARRYGEHADVVHAIEAHHNEVEPRTLEAVLTQAADAISGARPGARRESIEAYVKRLERLEEIAGAKSGVEKVFAMQAGREIRVMVLPDEVDDIGAQVMARDIAKQIEEELTYPGQIRITVVRESRASEVAR